MSEYEVILNLGRDFLENEKCRLEVAKYARQVDSTTIEETGLYYRHTIRQIEWLELIRNEEYSTYFEECRVCGEIFYIDDVVELDERHIYCSECFERAKSLGLVVQCLICDEWHSIESDYLTPVYNYRNEKKGYICLDCIERGDNDTLYEKCDECGRYYDVDDLEYLERYEESVCPRCLASDFSKCPDCGEYYRDSDTSYYIEDNDETICESCYENGEYFCCDSCGDYFSENSYAGDGMCQRCYEEENENELLFNYGYKPSPAFHHIGENSKLYFGVENEFSFYDYSDRNNALEAIEKANFDSLFYCKEDASLENGVETVTHPFTLGYMLKNRKRFANMLARIEENGALCRDGLHVHVSRSAMSEAHENRFGAFIYANLANLLPVARRSSNSYCKSKASPKNGYDVQRISSERDRYFAVNYTNRNTIELRIFRDTCKVTEYFASVQLVHAIYQFTKNCCKITEILQNPDTTWRNFLQYIGQEKRYYDLVKVIKANGSDKLSANDYCTLLLAVEKAEKNNKRIEARKEKARKAA